MNALDCDAEKDARLHAMVHGRVQGVSFRYSTVLKAQELGVAGYVRNKWDGTVEVVAEGPQRTLQQLLVWLRIGPRPARVSRVDTTWQVAKGNMTSFEVRW